MVAKLQQSFTGGELSPSLYARVSFDKFDVSARKLKNFVVHPHGGASNRPGWMHLGRPKHNDKQHIFIPFEFSTEQTYELEFGDLYMRVWKDDGLVLSDTTYAVSAIQNSNHALITTSEAHGLSAGQWVLISGIDAGSGTGEDITALNGRFFYVDAVVSTTSFTISDLDGNEFSTGEMNTWVSGGTLYLVYELETPYLEEHLPYLEFFQSADQLTIVNENYHQRELLRHGHADWELRKIWFESQVETPMTGPTLSASSGAAGSGATAGYVYTAVIGGEESLPSPETEISVVPAWPAGHGVKISIPDPEVDALPRAEKYNIYKRKTAGAVGGKWGWIGSTDETANRVFEDLNFSPDMKNTVITENRDPFSPASGVSGDDDFFKVATWNEIWSYQEVPLPTAAAISVPSSIVVPSAGYSSGQMPFGRTGNFAYTPAYNTLWNINKALWIKKTITTSGGELKFTQIAEAMVENSALFFIDGQFVKQVGSGVADTSYGSDGEFTIQCAAGTHEIAVYCLDETADFGATDNTYIAFEIWERYDNSRDGQDANYPSCGTYYRQRRIFAAPDAEPQTIFPTQVGNYSNMNMHDPLVDSDAFVYEIASNKLNRIRFLVELDKMLALTTGGPWVFQGDSNKVFSGATCNSEKNGSVGAARVRPVVVSSSCVYVRDTGRGLVSSAYSFADNQFSGTDLSILATHLFEGREIRSICYQETPDSVIWVCFQDGGFAALTYNKEHQVFAWTSMETNGRVEWLSCVRQGTESVVIASIKRFVGGRWVRFIERLADRDIRDIRDAFLVDCGITRDSPAVITDISVDSSGIVTVTAESHGASDGDIVDISDVVGMVEEVDESGRTASAINNRKFAASDCSADTMVLKKKIAPKNYCSNPIGYGLSGWTLTDCTVTPGFPDPYGGNGAIRVLVTGLNAHIKQLFSDTSPVVGSMSVWIKRVAGGDAGYALESIDGMETGAEAPEEWTEVKYEDFAANENDYHAVYFNAAGSGGSSVPSDGYYLFGPKAVADTEIGDFADDYFTIDTSSVSDYRSDGNLRVCSGVLTGLQHLAGESVVGLADGVTFTGEVSESGSVDLPFPAGRVHCGLRYRSLLETMDLEMPEAQTVGKQKAVSSVSIKVKDSASFKISGASGEFYSVKMNSMPDLDDPVEAETGEVREPVPGGWLDNGRIRIMQDEPAPVTILSIAPEFEIGG